MPSKSFGNSVGSGSAATLTLAYDSIGYDSTNGWLINPRIQWSQNSGWSDSNNYVDSGGTAINGARVHSGLLNSSRTWNCSAKGVALTYGSTTPVTFTATVNGVSFFNGDGATNTYTFNIEFPARPYELPLTPLNFTGTYVSDTRVDLAWQVNYTSASQARPWIGLRLDRWDNVSGVGTRIANLSWRSTSYSDTTAQPNRQYRYRLWAYNSAGDSSIIETGNIYTTPAAPSTPVAAKNADGSITVTATNNAPNATVWEISDSANGSTGWVVLSNTLTSSTYNHLSPNTSVPHYYRMRAKTPDGKWSAYSGVSNVVQLQAPPNAPSWLASEAAYDASTAITLGWRHNPVDTTPQTAYEVRWRASADNGSTWTAWTSTGGVTSTTPARTFAASFFPQNRLIEVQVRTWGAHSTSSPWSATKSFRTSAKPTVGITTPANGSTHSSTRAAGWLKWTYSDVEGTAQAGYRVVLYHSTGATVLGQWSGSGSATSFTLPYQVSNNTTYQVGVQVKDGAGLWSTETRSTFTVVFLPPPLPIVISTWDTNRGASILQISNPARTGSEPVAVSNNIYRDGELIAQNVNLNTTFIDPLPLTTGSTYRVEAVSALPSSNVLEFTQVANPGVARRFWLNAGAGMARAVSWYGNVSRGRETEIYSEVDTYSGREYPVETLGESAKQVFSFSTTVIQSESPPEEFHSLIRERTTKCFRGPEGRFFVSAPKVSESTSTSILAAMNLSFQVVDYTEVVR